MNVESPLSISVLKRGKNINWVLFSGSDFSWNGGSQILLNNYKPSLDLYEASLKWGTKWVQWLVRLFATDILLLLHMYLHIKLKLFEIISFHKNKVD